MRLVRGLDVAARDDDLQLPGGAGARPCAPGVRSDALAHRADRDLEQATAVQARGERLAEPSQRSSQPLTLDLQVALARLELGRHLVELLAERGEVVMPGRRDPRGVVARADAPRGVEEAGELGVQRARQEPRQRQRDEHEPDQQRRDQGAALPLLPGDDATPAPARSRARAAHRSRARRTSPRGSCPPAPRRSRGGPAARRAGRRAASSRGCRRGMRRPRPGRSRRRRGARSRGRSRRRPRGSPACGRGRRRAARKAGNTAARPPVSATVSRERTTVRRVAPVLLRRARSRASRAASSPDRSAAPTARSSTTRSATAPARVRASRASFSATAWLLASRASALPRLVVVDEPEEDERHRDERHDDDQQEEDAQLAAEAHDPCPPDTLGRPAGP